MKELEKLTKNLKNRQKITQKALDILNKICDELDEIYKYEKKQIIGKLKLEHCISSYNALNTYCYRAFKSEHGYKEIPTNINSLGNTWCACNDYNMIIDYITKDDLFYILHNIKNWILEKANKEKEFANELKNILDDIKKIKN